MRCDHACAHCGSRAATARPDELDWSRVEPIMDSLTRLGTREVTLIGGEAYLHPRCTEVVAGLTKRGIRVTMQTGGRGITPLLAQRLKVAGVRALGFSIDGPADVHDTLRASKGSHRSAMAGIAAAREAGIPMTANTQINRLILGRLEETAELLYRAGVKQWRPQLTVPMGRAADRPDWILEPFQILEVLDQLAEIQLRHAEANHAAGRPPERTFAVTIGNNLGYYSPHEVLLRSRPGHTADFWRGCRAGQVTMSISSNGEIKPCPSLPEAPYVGGDVRELSIEDIWNANPVMRFTQERTADERWGFCATCEYGDTCMAGCSFTAHCTLGRRGNMPFCYHRASTLKERGVRERLRQVEAASGQPYDFGRFELIEEPWSSDQGSVREYTLGIEDAMLARGQGGESKG